VPIAVGESEFTRFDFLDIAQRGGADFFQPDLAICGGISEAMRIGAIASAYNLRLAPHLWTGALAFAAGLHVTAACPAGYILEYSLGANPLLHELAAEKFDPRRHDRNSRPPGPRASPSTNPSCSATPYPSLADLPETIVHAFLFRPFAVLAAALALTALAPLPAQAQQTPGDLSTRPLRIIVPFAPGGATDVLARMIGQKLTDAWGQQVVVENRPVPVATSAPRQARGRADGYTLTLAAAGFMAVNPSLYAKLPYDSVKDFAPVSLLVKAPLLLVANSTLPSRNVRN
jgi:hypothetical protein